MTEPAIIVSDRPPFSPYFDTPSPLTTKDVGMHAVSVEADIAPDPALPNLPLGVREAVGKIAGDGSKGIDADAGAQAQSLLNSLSSPAGSNLPPLKVGILSSSNHSVTGLGAVQYVNDALRHVVSITGAKPPPDSHVESHASHYEVVASDPSKPCKFLFPVTSGGAFEIEDIQGHVTQQGTKYSGMAILSFVSPIRQAATTTSTNPFRSTSPTGMSLMARPSPQEPSMSRLASHFTQRARRDGKHRSHPGPHIVPRRCCARRSGRDTQPDAERRHAAPAWGGEAANVERLDLGTAFERRLDQRRPHVALDAYRMERIPDAVEKRAHRPESHARRRCGRALRRPPGR